MYITFVCLVMGFDFSSFSRVAKTLSPPSAEDISGWVGRIFPHIVGFREWFGFLKNFGPHPPSAGESYMLLPMFYLFSSFGYPC